MQKQSKLMLSLSDFSSKFFRWKKENLINRRVLCQQMIFHGIKIWLAWVMSAVSAMSAMNIEHSKRTKYNNRDGIKKSWNLFSSLPLFLSLSHSLYVGAHLSIHTPSLSFHWKERKKFMHERQRERRQRKRYECVTEHRSFFFSFSFFFCSTLPSWQSTNLSDCSPEWRWRKK